jgi:hypothetical protein
MMQLGLIGIAAGAAAALLFSSVTTGSLLSVVLFYLAPLPLMIAGLGWSHWSALIGAAFGTLAIASIFGSIFFFGFLASAGLPAWWLSYLAMLARPSSGDGGAAALEWYPPGRLVIWGAILAALVVLVAIPNFGTDADSFRAGMRDALTKLLRVETGEGTTAATATTGIDFLVTALPPAAAVLATIINVLDLWLAGRIVKFSGRLARPWPQIATMQFPRSLMAVLAIVAGLSFLGGLVGILAGVVAASLLMAYGILGFAVLHAITQGMSARGFLLGGAYTAAVLLGWPVLALCLLGLVESAIDLRALVARTRGPPSLRT